MCLKKVARVTGLEPATSGVTGRHSNQLSYTRAKIPPRPVETETKWAKLGDEAALNYRLTDGKPLERKFPYKINLEE